MRFDNPFWVDPYSHRIQGYGILSTKWIKMATFNGKCMWIFFSCLVFCMMIFVQGETNIFAPFLLGRGLCPGANPFF